MSWLSPNVAAEMHIRKWRKERDKRADDDADGDQYDNHEDDEALTLHGS